VTERSARLTVVIPTRNRPEAVLRLLRALDRQLDVPGDFDVVVVADGCTDGTVARVRGSRWRFPLHVLEQPAAGPAAARNCGAALATGDILLFLDDDVEPEPEALRAHAAFHAAVPHALAVGYLPPLVEQGGLLGQTLRGWWEAMFDGPRQPGHRYTWQNVLTGHLSISHEAFRALGGYDPTLRCHEDYEFGYRALEAGLTFRFLPEAVAWHHETTNLAKVFARKVAEGRADVQLTRRHPELVTELPLGWPPGGGRVRRLLLPLVWRGTRVGDRIAQGLARSLPLLERWRLRHRWRGLLESLVAYWYWRGVAEEIGSADRLAALLEQAPAPAAPECVLDLSAGLRAAEQRLDAMRPRAVSLVYGEETIGAIPSRPGAERLGGAHLRHLLARPPLVGAYLRAVARAGGMPEPLAAALLAAAPATSETSEAFAA
jgi:hypothetical protein